MVLLEEIRAQHKTRIALVDNPAAHGVVGGKMGEETPAARNGQPNPPWSQVAVTTVRLWYQRHGSRRRRNGKGRQRSARGQRLVFALSAIAAMALGALLTLALTRGGQRSAVPQPSYAARSTTPTQLQVAAHDRAQAAAWIAQQILPSAVIGCDPEMCGTLEAAGVSAGRLYEFQLNTPDPLNTSVVVATPAVRNQFGNRLASVYAPLLLATFGTGPEHIDVRVVEPGGTAAFNAALASDLAARIEAGHQLLTNKNVHASAAARGALLAGRVDPRLLVTLSALAAKMPVQLILFDDSSPGASVEIPLRGAEIGAATASGLAAIMGFLAAQRSDYLPSSYQKVTIHGGQSAVAVQFDAPGPLGLNGT
jgi:hypothetical protein